MRARVFDPFRGEFLQRDPSGYADSVNMYAGFAWDPVNLKDPTGKCVWYEDEKDRKECRDFIKL